MRTTFKSMPKAMAVGMLWLVFLVGSTRADEGPAPTNPQELLALLATAAQPAPEHDRLRPLEGTWTYTCKIWMDPASPPVESKGTIERSLVLGGRFLEERFEGTNIDGNPGFEGLGLVGFDKAQQKYTTSWVSNMCTGTASGVGSFDPSGTLLTFEVEAFCPVEKRVIKSREQIRFESDDKTVAETYEIRDGKERKMMEVIAVRKK